MNLSHLFTGSLIICAACQPQHDGFTINGKLTGEAENGKVYIQKVVYTEEEAPILDSTLITNGMFQLKGKVDEPEMYRIIIDLNKPDEEDWQNKKFSCPFYLENSEISFEGDIATLPGFFWSARKTVSPTITGSSTHDLYLSYQKQLKEINDTLQVLNYRYINEYNLPAMQGKEDTQVGIEIVKAEKEWTTKLQNKTLEFIRQNPSSIVSYDLAAAFVNGMAVDLTKTQIDEMITWLKPHWKHSPKMEALLLSAEKAGNIAIGEKFLDETFLNTKGENVKLSSLIEEGKYVMLEFWASWCGPCRGEIPHLVKIHKKYPDFKIISISIDEKDADWKKAMKEEGMTWDQLRIEGGFYGEAAKAYHITGVPTCIILDKEGRFYKTNMRGAYLDEFLQSIYGR